MNRKIPSVGLLFVLLLGFSGCSSFDSDKRIRVPIHVNYSVNDPEFGRSISRLLGPPLVEGNSITQLVNGDQIFPSMLEAIRGAKHTICLANFIWSSGIVSTQFVKALSERARAGVKVHVVVDALGSLKLSKADVNQMTQSGEPSIAPQNSRGGWENRLHRRCLSLRRLAGKRDAAPLARYAFPR
jgi:cardiolipin synthase